MHLKRLALAGFCFALTLHALADGAPRSAIDRYHALKARLVAEKFANNWSAFRNDAGELGLFLNGSPASQIERARANLQLGDPTRAKPYVDAFLVMGQVHPILDTPLFAPLKQDAAPRIAQNKAPVSLAAPVFTFSDASLVVEDIDYDGRTRRFFVTTVVGQKIAALRLDGHEEPFAAAPDHWPLLAIKIDSPRRRLWATEVALDGFTGVPKSEQGRSAVLEYDIDSGKLLGRFEPPQKGALGDMALDTGSNPIVSDNTGGGVWRLTNGTFARIDKGDFISPQTSTIDGSAILVPDYLRGVGRMDPATGAVRWLDMQNRFALNGIDGLYVHDDQMIAVQNGTMPERVVEWSLNPAHDRVLDEKIIERATPSLGDPTHGVVVGNDFYYVANSGWDKLNDDGTPVPGATRRPARIMRVPL